MEDTDTQWLTVQETARHLAIPARQVYRFIDEDELDAFRVDGDVMLRAEDVARHRDAGRA
ncbi:MAG TPA: helix-turn-helix domain-containing protein [Acidimicrobiales bacterium]|nr:helix-turn-helix domain-containing protein [Acidimicrobiales bacterium]